MPTVDIHGFAGSTYVRTARMTCAEKQVPHRLVPLEFRADSHRALHPFLRMPALTAGKLRLYETLAIATYIDHVGAGPALQPDDPARRAEMVQWISVCTDYLYNDVVRALLKSDGGDAELDAARSDFEVVNRALSGRQFLTGGRITLADLFLAPIVGFALSQPSGKKLFRGLDDLLRWHERMAVRPSYQATAS